MLPTVSFDDPSGTYTFTLWRDDKEVIHTLRGLAVYLEVIPDDDYETTGNVKHYIYVKTYENEDMLISLSKDEYDVLDPMLMEIEEENFERYEYEFTRTTLRDMHEHPEKYGPEMRARAMIWDESDAPEAYREHPLDHE
jgi:hypothetical protein